MSHSLAFQDLLAKAGREFPHTKASICFGEHTIEYYRPADPESALNDEILLSPHGELEWQPYWAQAWDAGLGMCQHVLDLDLRGKRILDLGCGIGLTSALLLAAGADLVCGDNAPPSLLFAELNTWPWRDRVEVKHIDWHATDLGQTFDTIVGSDIVYERGEVAPLDRFFRQHLMLGGSVILSDPSRPMTRDFLERFQQLGWELRESAIAVEGVRQPIRIVTMTLQD